MNIIVLCGGLSAERDVSLSTGSMAAAALRRLGHKAVVVDMFFGYTGTYEDPKEIFDKDVGNSLSAIGALAPDLESVKAMRGDDSKSRVGKNVFEVCAAADLVFVALHGADGEDGKIQAAFDLMGIKYTGSGHVGSAVAMDKKLAKDMFNTHGIKTPKGITVCASEKPYRSVGFPCVVKPRSGGSSVGTSVIFKEEDYLPALQEAFKYDDYVIAEQYIRGRECDVGVLAGKALPPIEICPKSGFYDYKNKYQSGLTDEYCPADLPSEVTEHIEKIAVDVYNALGLEVYARMDFMIDADNGIWCLEANTLPGLTPTSLLPQEAAAEGMNYDELIARIVSESLKKYGD